MSIERKLANTRKAQTSIKTRNILLGRPVEFEQAKRDYSNYINRALWDSQRAKKQLDQSSGVEESCQRLQAAKPRKSDNLICAIYALTKVLQIREWDKNTKRIHVANPTIHTVYSLYTWNSSRFAKMHSRGSVHMSSHYPNTTETILVWSLYPCVNLDKMHCSFAFSWNL